MMFNKLTVLAVAATLAEIASAAVGKARVVNNCPFSVTVWSVGSDISPARTLAKSGGVYSETFTRDPKTGGRSLKITLEPNGLFTGKPQTNFAYNLQDPVVWYDMSDVFGDPFKGRKLVIASANKNCPQIVWANGVPPAGSQVKNCGASNDVTLTLCA